MSICRVFLYVAPQRTGSTPVIISYSARRNLLSVVQLFFFAACCKFPPKMSPLISEGQTKSFARGSMAEQAYAAVSKTAAGNGVRVQISLLPPSQALACTYQNGRSFFLWHLPLSDLCMSALEMSFAQTVLRPYLCPYRPVQEGCARLQRTQEHFSI